MIQHADSGAHGQYHCVLTTTEKKPIPERNCLEANLYSRGSFEGPLA